MIKKLNKSIRSDIQNFNLQLTDYTYTYVESEFTTITVIFYIYTINLI